MEHYRVLGLGVGVWEGSDLGFKGWSLGRAWDLGIQSFGFRRWGLRGLEFQGKLHRACRRSVPPAP